MDTVEVHGGAPFVVLVLVVGRRGGEGLLLGRQCVIRIGWCIDLTLRARCGCSLSPVGLCGVIRIGWTLRRLMPSRYIVFGGVPCYGQGGALFGGGGGVNQDRLAHRPIPEVRSSRTCGGSLLRRAGA